MFSLQDFVQQCISESPLLSLVTSRSSSGDVDAKPNEVIMGLFEDGVPLNPSVNRFIIIVPLEIWPNWEGYPIFINFRYFQTPKYNRQLTTFRCFSDFWGDVKARADTEKLQCEWHCHCMPLLPKCMSQCDDSCHHLRVCICWSIWSLCLWEISFRELRYDAINYPLII